MIINDISLARKALLNDDVVAIPTETVYGLAGNAYSEKAIRKIFALKNRPFYNPLIVHIASVAQLPTIAKDIPALALQLAATFWPGPLTLLLKKQQVIPDLVTAGKDTVAVRVPNHTVTQQLLRELDFPLVAPSANPFGSISPTTSAHVFQYFNDTIPIILEGGPCIKGVESTIIGFEGDVPVLYRLGAIATEAIEQITGPLQKVTHAKNQPNAPGMLNRHYAPHTTTYLTDNVWQLVQQFPNQKIGLLLWKEKAHEQANVYSITLSSTANMEEAAANLYASLHQLDDMHLDVIIAERLPDSDLGKTINDRLQRATQQW
ncbi:L-threonylcarbamoyladenylate synthase [Hydrotalea sp.]|uniref:L-threonylcarbamoyladenylate synthase n=1 Tax=Hydrotalea sp. TaxID=2881279 RepID=UPI00262B55FD|nr:L-threonylcarbamoyladenylate synthase [Hydrotalea sp.]